MCEPGYGGNDCSLRQCPQYPAWVDSPRGDLNHDGRLNYGVTTEDPAASAGAAPEVFPPLAAGVHDDAVTATSGEAHYYAECANRGNCNRDTGVCACFPGYTGAGCQRGASAPSRGCACTRRHARPDLRCLTLPRAPARPRPRPAPPPFFLQPRAPRAAPARACAARCARWRRWS